MPTDEKNDEILKLIRERAEARKRRAALEKELKAVGKSLYEIGGALKHVCGGRIGNGIDYVLPKIHSAPPSCDLSTLAAMLEELKRIETALAQLNRMAIEMEID